jgi:P-loop Domain of unknown function (DUF2791)
MTSSNGHHDKRRIIRALRSGVASPLSARAITVGTEAVEMQLGKQADSLLNGVAGSRMILVSGDWGFGKSHIRMLCIEELCKRGIPHVQDCINGSSGSLSHLHRCVPRWLEGIRIGPVTGLRDALEVGQIDREKAYRWCREHTSRFSSGLRLALGNPLWWNYAVGHQWRTPDYPYQHEKALEMLVGVGRFVSNMGKGGLAVLLDEGENISRQYDIRGRRKSYDVLSRLAGSCHFCCVLFVTKRFFHQVDEDARRGFGEGWHGWTEAARKFVTDIKTYPTIEPPVLTRSLARDLVMNIVATYQEAFGRKIGDEIADDVIRGWEVTATRSGRLLVRLTVNHLDVLSG